MRLATASSAVTPLAVRIAQSALHNLEIVPGVTAKVFRTMKASNEFQKTLKRTNNLRQANLKAAHVCNHKSGTGDNLQTSRSNYIDPRIYYAYVHAHPEANRSSWFADADWAKKTDASFVF